MPTSCCRRRPISRPRISTAPTAPTGCSTATAAVAPQGEARSNFGVAQALAARMGLDDPIFRMSPRTQIVQELFRGATGTVAQVDPDELFATAGRSTSRRKGGQQFRTPSGKLEFYSEHAGQAGPAADARLAARPAGSGRRRPLAAAPADRARLFPGAHRLFRASASCASARAAVLHPASRGGARRAASPTAQQVRLFNERGAVGLVLRVSDEVQPGVVLVPGQRPDERGGRPARSTCCAPTATPTWARARPTRAPFSTWPRGARKAAPHPTPQRPSVTTTRP